MTGVTETAIETEFGGSWRLIIYRNDVTDVEHIVYAKGRDIAGHSCHGAYACP